MAPVLFVINYRSHHLLFGLVTSCGRFWVFILVTDRVNRIRTCVFSCAWTIKQFVSLPIVELGHWGDMELLKCIWLPRTICHRTLWSAARSTQQLLWKQRLMHKSQIQTLNANDILRCLNNVTLWCKWVLVLISNVDVKPFVWKIIDYLARKQGYWGSSHQLSYSPGEKEYWNLNHWRELAFN